MDNEISIKKAAMINAVSKYVTVFFQLFFSSVLARILSPKDYGIVAVITIFVNFFTIIADIGVGNGVIQNKTLSNDDLNNIFSFSFYIGIGFAILFVLFSFPMAMFYKNYVYIYLGLLLAVSLFFNTLNMVPNALILKKKEFVLIGIRTVVSSIVTSVATIIMALCGMKYYALALQSIFTALFLFLWNYKNSQLRLKWKFDMRSIQKIREFSTFQFAFNVINYFSRNMDNILVSIIMGTVALGYYDKSYKLVLYPVNYLTYVINEVLHPILSDKQDYKKLIYDQYIKVVKLLSLLGVFITIYCFFASREIILIMFGNQWKEAIVCFKILSITIWFQMTAASIGAVFQSIGDTKTMFVSCTVFSVIILICIFIGTMSGNLAFLSVCVTVGYIIRFFIEYAFLIKKGFKYSLCDFYKNLLPDVFIFIVTVVGMVVAERIVFYNIIISAVYKLITCLFVYGVCLLVTKQYRYLLKILPSKERSLLR